MSAQAKQGGDVGEGVRQAGWTAIVLAGQRPGPDPFAEKNGQTYKALIEIGGMSMLRRVTGALLASRKIGRIVILAQSPDLLMQGDMSELADDPRMGLASSNSGIATSIAAIAGTDTARWPVLVVTADHALLTAEMVDEFLGSVGDADLAIAVGERSIVERAYPMTKRTWLKFSDGHYSGANLFALQGPDVGPALALWSTVEQDRKKGWKIFARFGPYLLFRALSRTIGFADAVQRAGKRLGLAVKPVTMSQAEAVIDVDKESDLILVREILGRTKP